LEVVSHDVGLTYKLSYNVVMHAAPGSGSVSVRYRAILGSSDDLIPRFQFQYNINMIFYKISQY